MLKFRTCILFWKKNSAIECESGNVEVRWNYINKCVLDSTSDLFRQIERIPIKPRITQEIVSKTDEGRKWKNVNIEEGRKNCKELRNEKNRDMNMAKKEYLESICEITKFKKK
jgi:hypothetical protein